jgi:uncharacterized protein YfaT (DUF1175 family)
MRIRGHGVAERATQAIENAGLEQEAPLIVRERRKHISRKDARPGDLIFVHNGSGYVHHVAIYAGNGTWWEAPHTGSWVRHVKIWSNKIEFRRLVGN